MIHPRRKQHDPSEAQAATCQGKSVILKESTQYWQENTQGS